MVAFIHKDDDINIWIHHQASTLYKILHKSEARKVNFKWI